MKKLEKACTFGYDFEENWQIRPNQLREIKNKIDIISHNYIYEEDIETVCIALIALDYMKFKEE